MEILRGKRFLAVRCLVVIGSGLAFGILVAESISWILWTALGFFIASIAAMLLVDKRFLYLTLLSLAILYGRFSLPEKLPDSVYGSRLEYSARKIEKSGSYTVFKIITPTELEGRKTLVFTNIKLEPGTVCRFEGKLDKLIFPSNPGVRDRNKRLARDGVIGRITTDAVKIIGKPAGMQLWLNSVRNGLIERSKELFGIQSGTFTSLLLGDRSQVADELHLDMKRTGTLHLLAVSGLHVGILVAFMFLLLRIVRFPRKWVFPLLVVILALYVALVSPRPSIIRASIMSLVIVLGLTLERKVLPVNIIAIAALIIILIRPAELFELGFQLSFAASLGIILVADYLKELTRSKKSLINKIPKWIRRWLVYPIFFSAAATLFTMPFLASVFHQITFGTILANLPAIPMVTLALPLGIVSLLFSVLWFPLGKFVGFAVSGILWALEKTLHVLPGKLINTGPWPVAIIVAMLAAAIIIHSEKANRKRYLFVLGVLLVGANLAIWPWALKSHKPRLSIVDTYHGNVALLETDNRVILINPGSRAEPTVTDYLLARNIRHIDWVLCMSVKEGDLSNLDSLVSSIRIDSVGSVVAGVGNTCLPNSGMLSLPSCTLTYDLASRSKPYYTVYSENKKTVFASTPLHLDSSADLTYLLNEHLQPTFNQGFVASKYEVKDVESYIVRERGGMVIKY